MNYLTSEDLINLGFYREKDKIWLERVLEKYPCLVPNSILKRFSNKVILKQFLPDKNELLESPNYKIDPLNENYFQKIPGLIHRFENRILLIPTYKCFFYCRFCFRKNINKKEIKINVEDWIDYIERDKKINEIIITGGEPFINKPIFLIELFEKLRKIPHLKFFRIHTRGLVFFPKVLNKDLLKFLRYIKNLTIVFHINHPLEINNEFKDTVVKLRKNNILLLNQNVLLKGINDNIEILYNLYKELGMLKILPYYCHQLDKTRGTTHFYVPIYKGKKIFIKLKNLLPGYLVPRYVIDLVDNFGKKIIV